MLTLSSLPGFGTQVHTGLYISAETICALGAQLIAGTTKVLGYSEMEGHNDLLDPEAIKNQAFLDKLKMVLRNVKTSPKSVSMAVPSEGSIIRYFELPILPKKEEKSAVRFEAQKYIPFDIKDLYYDYESYPNPKRKKTGVVFFACKKQWVDPATQVLASLGIRLERVELVSQSVTRAFYHLYHSGKVRAKEAEAAEILVMPINEKNADLILFKKSSVLMTRHLPLSRQPGALSWDTPFFISEIRISLDYFYENFKEEKVEKIHLAIASAENTKPLQEALQKEFSLPVENAQFPNILEQNRASTPAMAATYGLALGRLLPEKGKRVNLHPSEGGQTQTLSWNEEKKQLQDLAVKETLAVAGVIFILSLLLSNFVAAKQADLRKTMDAYPKAASAKIEDPLDALKTKESRLLTQTAFLSNFMDKRSYFTIKMNRFVRAVPEYVCLTALRFTGNVGTAGDEDLSLHLEGYVLSPESGGDITSVNKLVRQLASDNEFMRGFSDIKIGATRRDQFRGSPATRFSLDCVRTQRGGP